MSDTLTAEQAMDLLTETEIGNSEEGQTDESVESEDQALPVTDPGGPAEAEGEAEVETEETEETSEPLFTVKVDGQEMEVPAAELVKSYQLQKHLDNKLSEVNRERTTISQDSQRLQQEKAELVQQRQQYVQGIEAVQQALANQGLEDPDPQLLEDNPAEYVRQKTAVDKRRAQIQGLEDRKQQEIAQHQQEMASKIDEMKRTSMKTLQSDIQEWQDVDKMRSDIQAIERTMQNEFGITEQELSTVYDARFIKVMRAAHAYNQLVENGRLASKKVQPTAPKVPRGAMKAKPKTEADKAEANFKKLAQGHDTVATVDAAADLLIARKG